MFAEGYFVLTASDGESFAEGCVGRRIVREVASDGGFVWLRRPEDRSRGGGGVFKELIITTSHGASMALHLTCYY